MILFYRALLFLGLTLLPFTLLSQNAKTENNSAKTDQIFEAIHLERQLFEFSEEIKELISQNPFGLSATLNEQMIQQYQKAFAKQFLLADARQTFEEEFNPQHADSTLRWLDQETTQKVLRAEEDYYSLQGIRKRVIHQHELEKDPPPEDRITLINTLVERMEVDKIKLKSKTILFRAFLEAFNDLNKIRTFNYAQREDIIENYRNRLKTNMKQQVQTQFLLAYYTIDNKKLQEFSSFYDTDAGKWLNHAKSAALYSAYQSAADRFLELIRKL